MGFMVHKNFRVNKRSIGESSVRKFCIIRIRMASRNGLLHEQPGRLVEGVRHPPSDGVPSELGSAQSTQNIWPDGNRVTVLIFWPTSTAEIVFRVFQRAARFRAERERRRRRRCSTSR